MKIVIPFLRQLAVGAVALTVLVPFVYTDSTTFPFVFSKVITLRIIVEIAFALTVALAIFDSRYRPHRSKILIALGCYTLALLLSVVFGVDSFRSFWGNHERMSGFFSILHTLLLIPLAALLLRTEKHWERFWIWALAAADGMAAIGLIQYFSTHNFLLTQGGGRIWATLGNYIYLGQYSLFFTFIAWGVAAAAEDRRVKIFAATTGVLQLIILLLTETRGALLGFIAGSLFLIGWYIRRGVVRESRTGRTLAIAGGVLFAAFIVFFFFGHNTRLAHYLPGIRRLTYIGFTESVGGTSTRLIAWQIAIEAFAHRPVFGYGVDAFHIAFNRFYHPESLRYGYYETWFDRAHNAHLDTLAMTGIVGVAATLFLYFAVFKALLRSAQVGGRRASDRAAFALAVFISYLVQLTFVFDSPTSYLLIALFYAFVVRLEWGDEPLPPSDSDTPIIPISSGRSALASASALAILIVLFVTNIQPVRANRLALATSIEAHVNRNLLSAVERHREALAVWTPHRRDLQLDFGRDLSEAFGAYPTGIPEALRPAWQEALTGIEENIARYHDDAYEYLLLGMLYQQGANLDPEALKKAAAALEAGIPFSPKRQQMYFTLAKTYLLLGRRPEALAALEKVISFDDTIPDPHWYYGLTLVDDGRIADAWREVHTATTLGYEWKSPIEAIFAADIARKNNDAPAAYAYLRSVSSTYASEPQYQAQYAEAAFAVQKYDEAIAAARAAVAGDPSLAGRLGPILRHGS